MNSREEGFLLLTSHLGDPERRPLTVAQLRTLGKRMELAERPEEDRELTWQDLKALGYGEEMARHIESLLSQTQLLSYYLQKAAFSGCVPVTRVSPDYPLLLRRRLGLDAPGVLWAKGNLALLQEPGVSLVGSRELRAENGVFAAKVGEEAARQGYVLISGNARGADRTAQNGCLAAGGRVISVVADELNAHPLRENVLYLSEDGFADGFSAQRALSRNRVIHALGLKTFVAQTACGMGGTWDGTEKNLRHGWSSVYGFRDGSEGMRQLEQLGAQLIELQDLGSFYDLQEQQWNFLDR